MDCWRGYSTLDFGCGKHHESRIETTMNIIKKLGGLLGKSKSSKKRSKTSLKLDRLYTSKEGWEKAYTPKRKKHTKHPRQK